MALIRYERPLTAFRYIIEIEKDGAAAVAAAFSRFSGVKMRVETMKVRTGADERGVMRDFPVMTSFENVTFSRGVVGDLDFLDWILAVAPDGSRAATGKSVSDKYRSISVSALNEAGKRAVTWTLIDALPVAYELGEMNSTQSALLTESVEFVIAGFKREVSAESFESAGADSKSAKDALHARYEALRRDRRS
ncbi:MAG: phage tail protein [Oscillospiraceae bacterium]|jgi:phage tail-like protein|nr:phage tail protein [Oscillospiraceae bacterium]